MVSGSVVEMEFRYQVGDDITAVQVEREGEVARITIADRVYEVSVIHSRANELRLMVNGARRTAYLAREGSTRYVAVDGDVFELKKPDVRRAHRKGPHGENNLTASMPGQVTKVLVGEGDPVQRGQPLIVLEAMKMEIKLAAPHDGRVTKVLVRQGQVVERGQRLIEMAHER
jgi:3-methylcrotonyl-CoA carboxylase alpha subunit